MTMNWKVIAAMVLRRYRSVRVTTPVTIVGTGVTMTAIGHGGIGLTTTGMYGILRTARTRRIDQIDRTTRIPIDHQAVGLEAASDRFDTSSISGGLLPVSPSPKGGRQVSDLQIGKAMLAMPGIFEFRRVFSAPAVNHLPIDLFACRRWL